MSTLQDFIDKPQSKKITIVEVDTPLEAVWINYEPGVWFTRISPGSQDIEDDNGNFAYWQGRNDEYFNIQSLNVGGEQYNEVGSIALVVSTEKSWYYDTATTDMYIRFEDWNPPNIYSTIAPGAAIGFTFQKDDTTNNYFEDISYSAIVESIPNISKKKDALFFGVLQYGGGSVTFDNTGGDLDDFPSQNLYNQPIRQKYTFEGLDISEQYTAYTGRLGALTPGFTSFKMQIDDLRSSLTRKLPVNELLLTDYPDMDDKLDGTPIPIAWGSIINAPAYKVTNTGGTETFIFYDDEFNAVDSGIVVVDKDGVSVTTAGTETDGTFTTSSTEDKLYVSFNVDIPNGLDIISDGLANYENKDFNVFNYDVNEWNLEKQDVRDAGIWIGKGNLMEMVDVIELVCVSNNLIFDILPDGRFTARKFRPEKTPTHEIYQDEIIGEASLAYNPREYISSIKIEYSEDILEKESELYTNTDFEAEVFGRYGQRKETRKPIKTVLTNQTDAISLSNEIMEQSRIIKPTVTLTTKMQNIQLRILDNVMYEHKRQNGKVIVARSRWQVLGITLDLTGYTMTITIKQIEEDDNIYRILDGGDSESDYDYYDGGDSTTTPTNTISGGGA